MSAREFLVILFLELGLIVLPITIVASYISANCNSASSACATTASGSANLFWIVFLAVPITLFVYVLLKIRYLRTSSVLIFNPDMENKVRFLAFSFI